MASLAVPLAGSLLSGIFGGKGAKAATKAQTQALQQAMAQQQAQFQQTRADNLPFLEGGQKGFASILDLLGVNGTDPQGAAIASLKASPGFTSLYNTGADTILQNAAATGGLRGGNTQNSLANFGSGLLASTIERQLANLGGIANIGAGTAGNLGSLGQSNANSISSLLEAQGNAKAGGSLMQGAIMGRTFNDIAGQIQGYGQKKWGW